MVQNPLPPDVFACAAGILCAPVIIDDEMEYDGSVGPDRVVCTRRGPARILSLRLRFNSDEDLGDEKDSITRYCNVVRSAYPWSNEATQVSEKDDWQDNEYRSVSLKVELPDDVLVMPGEFLHKAPGLKSVDLRSTRLTMLGEKFLASSSRFLAHVYLPNTVTSIGDSFLAFLAFESEFPCVDEHFPGAYFRSLDLRHLTGLKSIGSRFLVDCESLTELHLPPSVETIQGDFLHSCGLAYINLQHLTGLTSLAYSFMRSCSSLTELQPLLSITCVDEYFVEGTSIPSIDLRHTGLTSLGDSFMEYSSVSELQLPTSVTAIRSSFLRYCEKIETLDLRHLARLTSLEGEFMMSCPSLTVVQLPASITEINNAFLKRCSKITSIDLRHLTGLTSLAADFMSYSESLNQLQLPSSITAVDEKFMDNSSIPSMDLRHTGLTSLGDNFMQYSTVTELQFPMSVIEICIEFLCSCSKIETLDLRHLTGLVSLKDYFMVRCPSLKRVQLPASITEINNGFLKRCPKITSIDLRHLTGLTSLGEDFMVECAALKEVYLPNSVTESELPEGFLDGCKLNPVCHRKS